MIDRIVASPGGALRVTQCGACGVWHAIPEIMHQTALDEGGYWHCPNGHSRGYKTGREKEEQDRIRRERDQLRQQIARLADEAAAERRRADEAERKTVQVRKRAAAGVCPCCNRTFLNVQRHMRTKHPNVVPLEKRAMGTGKVTQ